MERQIFTGLAGAPGRVVGTAFRWEAAIAPDAPVQDVAALEAALAAAETRLGRALAGADATLAPLLEAQRLMLGDPEFHDEVFALVRAGTAPRAAVITVSAGMAAVLEASESAYFRERAIDMRALGKLVLEALDGGPARSIPAGAVVIAEELAPLDTAELAEAGIAGLITVRGGPTCHAAIIARAWGVPAVVGADAAVLQLPGGTPVLVDGTLGQVIFAPTPAEQHAEPAPAAAIHFSRRVPLYANIGSAAEVVRARARRRGGHRAVAHRVPFQGRATAPGEDEQTEEYTAIVQMMGDRPVIIRTLDIGADKPVPFLPVPAEPNPQLGLRGIRLCLHERALFLTPTARAAARGDCRAVENYFAHGDHPGGGMRGARTAGGAGRAAAPAGAAAGGDDRSADGRIGRAGIGRRV